MTAKEWLSEPINYGGEIMARGRAWTLARDAAVSRGAPDPSACADRYMQGAALREKVSACDAR